MRVRFRIARLFLCGIVLGGLVSIPALFTENTEAQEFHVFEPDDDFAVTYQTEQEAIETDIGLIADQTGHLREQVRQSILFQRAFSAYVNKLFVHHEDQISGIWTEFCAKCQRICAFC
ncbi:MAG: hypothetical protein MI924_19235 [Chloroflexales bacterium]|nr:hypothetical protein [Chloroflexales bacterium]